MIVTVDGKEMWVESPVHGSFGLTYASYLVWPRSVMEAMPLEWQERFVKLAEELNETFSGYEPRGGYRVNSLDESGRFTPDPFRNYRRPDLSLLESIRCPP